MRLGPGEFAVVPRDLEHRPVAETGTQILLFERHATVNTGEAREERTVGDSWV